MYNEYDDEPKKAVAKIRKFKKIVRKNEGNQSPSQSSRLRNFVPKDNKIVQIDEEIEGSAHENEERIPVMKLKKIEKRIPYKNK